MISLAILLLIFILGITIFFAIVISKAKSNSTVELMLLGIEITLVGGIVAVDNSSSLGGFEYLLILLGLAFTIGGYIKKHHNN